jgi:GT2 family glycosyltransferase
MIPVLGIPYLNRPDLLARCIKSIDYPVDQLVLIDNSNGTLERLGYSFGIHPLHNTQIRTLHLVQHANAGVAASWNEIITLFPTKWWLIVNNDIQFTPGDLRKMDTAMLNARLTVGMAYGNHRASWFGITEFGVREVGLFDANFYPAYLEDCDWSYRADLLGVQRINVHDCHAVHGDRKLTGSCTIYSDPRIQRNNARTHEQNFIYYRQKWGGINSREIYKTPFNDPKWPVWAWKFDPAIRARQTQLWEAK